jgi:hypothetical protein
MVMKLNKKILLVEPGYQNRYPPLGLMKISTWHNKQNDDVEYIKHIPTSPVLPLFENERKQPLKDHYDIIYITTLFTYYAHDVIEAIKYYQARYPNSEIKVGGIMATLLPEYIKERTRIEPHRGLWHGPEECSPDYTLAPNLKCSITFTSRGCPERCKFCAVRKHEPEFFVKENWEKDIDETKSKIIFWDNNWLASPNFEKDIEKLKKLGKSFDFNQGLDCRRFDAEKAKFLKQVNIKPIRFAFDNGSQEGHIQKAIKLAQEVWFKDIRVYVLYNYTDDPDYFYYRIDEMNKLGVLTYPMRFRPINNVNGRYISKKWDHKLLRALKLTLLFYYSGGMIRRNREAFQTIYGKNSTEFKNKLYEIYRKDRLRSWERKKEKKALERMMKLNQSPEYKNKAESSGRVVEPASSA